MTVADASALSRFPNGRGEPSIAVNPSDTDKIVISRFDNMQWGSGNADLL
ncbi:hypothetical protein ACFV2H_06885 [Streptomyces sp. NPDC059629]